MSAEAGAKMITGAVLPLLQIRETRDYSHRLAYYLDAEGFLSQPASGCPSVVFRRKGVYDPQLCTDLLKSIIS